MHTSKHSTSNLKSREDITQSDPSPKNHPKISHHRQSSTFSGRSSILLKRPIFYQDVREKRKSDYFAEPKETFDWEQFKKNPQASLLDDPAYMELITHEQLMEVSNSYIFFVDFFFFSVNDGAFEKTSQQSKNKRYKNSGKGD